MAKRTRLLACFAFVCAGLATIGFEAIRQRFLVIDARSALANYGYDWAKGAPEAETVSFQESLLTARESLDSPEEIKFDPVSKNPYFSYDEDDGSVLDW